MATLKQSDVHELFGGSKHISFTTITGRGQYVLNQNIDVNSINIAGSPSVDTHAATVGYVKNFVQGLDAKESVKCATTGNITLEVLQSIDGVNLATGDRVLVKDQTDNTKNGIYLAKSGVWQRVLDFDAPSEVQGAFVFVEQGTQNVGKGFVQVSTAPVGIGEGPLIFTQFNGTSQEIKDSINAKAVKSVVDASFGLINTALDGKQNTIVDGGLTIAKTSGLQSALDAKAVKSVVDASFGLINTALDGKQNTIVDGGLTIAKTSGLQSALDAKAVKSVVDASFGLINTALDGKQNTIVDGGLTIAKTSGLQSALDAKAVKSVVDASFTAILNEPANKVTTSQTATPVIGSMYYDTTGEGRLYMYNGNAWRYISFP